MFRLKRGSLSLLLVRLVVDKRCRRYANFALRNRVTTENQNRSTLYSISRAAVLAVSRKTTVPSVYAL